MRGYRVERRFGWDCHGLPVEMLAEQAMRDSAYYLRTGHLEQLRTILDDQEASDNDHFVAMELLKNAAIAAAGENPDASVALVSKVYPMRSHTVSAEGGLAAVMRDDDNFDSHAFDTIKGSDFLADQDVVEAFVSEARDEVIQLEHWGCPWSRDPDGRVSVRAFGGMSTKRTLYAADKTGFHMLHTLFQTSLQYSSIKRYDEWFVTKLLLENGRCQGLAAVEVRSGNVQLITARAVVLCTGGSGRIFPFTTK